MKTKLTPFLLAAAAALVPSLARADSPTAQMKSDAELKDWPACLLSYRYQKSRGISDDFKVDALAQKVDTLDAGATPTMKQLADACLAEAKRAPDAKDKWNDVLNMRVGGLYSDTARMKAGDDTLDYDTIHGEVTTCDDAADYAAQVLDPKQPLKYSANGQPDWTGTVATAHEICDAADQASAAMKEKVLAPYVKAGIKGDKLKMISDHIDTYLQVKGGESTNDPKKLAKSPVLFLEWEAGSCAKGTVTRLERFQFDKKGKLVKTSAHEYCGDIPKSAFK